MVSMQIHKADIQFKDKQFYIQGDLTLYNVMSIYEKSLPDLYTSLELCFDFSQLQSSDSSGLALIIEWIKFSNDHKKPIRFLNLSNDILSIAKVAGVDSLINESSEPR